MTLSRDELARREQALTNPGGRLFRSLTEIAEYEPPEVGIATGLEEIDAITGGLQPGRLNTFVGYTNHGKTAGMLTTVVNNLESGIPILFISCDDPDDDVFRKLLAMRNDLSVEDVIRKGKHWRRSQAIELEDRLMIDVPDSNNHNEDSLAVTMDEAKKRFGQYPALVAFDYLGCLTLPGHYDDAGAIGKKASNLKAFIRNFRNTTFMVGHQCNRQVISGTVTALTTGHVEYGGVKETDGVMIGFRRRLDTEELTDEEKEEEADYPTVHVSVMKNKVTGQRSRNPVGKQYAIDPISGLIRPRSMAEIRGKQIQSLADIRLRDASVRNGYGTDQD